MVASGEVGVYLGNAQVASTLIAELNLTNVALVRPTDLPLRTFHFALPNAMLDAAMSVMAETQIRAIHSQWLEPVHWEGDGLILSEAESSVMAYPLRLAIASHWEPILFLDQDGQSSGLICEYLRRFRAAGAHLQVIGVDTWQEIRAGGSTEANWARSLSLPRASLGSAMIGYPANRS